MKKTVVIGGGTGSFTVLKGLKNYDARVSAIVSMADDGGSTGVLRDELGVLPPGDVRQCLIALSESSEEMRKLMSYRFEEGSFKGHSFGNLFLSALEKTSGGFIQGVEEAMRILKVKGEVIPVTDQSIHLNVELNDGKIIQGETAIDNSTLNGHGFKRIFYPQNVKANKKAVERILEADTIVIGPGSHYSSIMPHLIIKEIAEAINKARGKVVYVANLTNKREHNWNYDVDDYVNEIEAYIGKGRVNYVIHNIAKPEEEVLRVYVKQEGEHPLVEFNEDKNLKRSYELISGDFLSSDKIKISKGDVLANRSLIRHDSDKLAKTIYSL